MADRKIVANVADLELWGKDVLGNQIIDFYAYRPPEYAIYRTRARVVVQYADSKAESARQRKALAPLNPIRGEINALTDDWRGKRKAGQPDDEVEDEKAVAKRRKAAGIDRRVGDALDYAFGGDVDGAKLLLENIKQEIYDERIARGRLWYLIWALAVVAAVLLLSLVVAGPLPGPDTANPAKAVVLGPGALWHGAGAGAIGAFFSIALAIRGRTTLPDFQPLGNFLDAALRVVIGVIGAAVLVGLVIVGVVSVKLGNGDITSGTLGWLQILLTGFVAGFSERFVPDLLAGATAETKAPKTAPPAPPPAQPAADAKAAEEPAAPAEAEEDPLPEEADEDSCVHGEVPDDLVTTDEQLPPAAGGVDKTAAN